MEFNVEVEDGSPLEIARQLIDMYKQCLCGTSEGTHTLQNALEHTQVTFPPLTACSSWQLHLPLPVGPTQQQPGLMATMASPAAVARRTRRATQWTWTSPRHQCQFGSQWWTMTGLRWCNAAGDSGDGVSCITPVAAHHIPALVSINE